MAAFIPATKSQGYLPFLAMTLTNGEPVRFFPAETVVNPDGLGIFLSETLTNSEPVRFFPAETVVNPDGFGNFLAMTLTNGGPDRFFLAGALTISDTIPPVSCCGTDCLNPGI
jgi:hypothetical protein